MDVREDVWMSKCLNIGSLESQMEECERLWDTKGEWWQKWDTGKCLENWPKIVVMKG